MANNEGGGAFTSFAINDPDRPGLAGTERDEWPPVAEGIVSGETSPIDALRPGTAMHDRVLRYLKIRLDATEDKMRQFYPRWRVNEEKAQAYINLPNYEKVLKNMNNAGGPPAAISVVVPYAYAALNTTVTFLAQMFLSRKPIFQVGAYRKESVEASKAMELALQYNSDHTRLVKRIWQWLTDGQLYGVQILMTDWEDRKAVRTVWTEGTPAGSSFVEGAPTGPQRTREERTVYSGNNVENIDPYLFFPDPNVPMTEVNRKGEFVFWRRFVGKHIMLAAERAGDFKYINFAGSIPVSNRFAGDSRRNAISLGDSIAGWDHGAGNASRSVRNVMQLDQGTVEIIPAELGLGPETSPQKWMFTIANGKQIVQAEVYDADHGMHPVAVAEPYTMGYGFGQPGQLDYVSPVQDILSFFINSHIDNVKGFLNNSLVVDPSAVEMQDLKNPGPGKRIRLKQSAAGRDIRTVLQQLQVGDVTRGHVSDMDVFYRIGDALTGTNDNLRGQQEQGGRKTATEIRRSTDSAGSRLTALAQLISAQGVVDLTEQMTLNIQQYMDIDFYMHLGSDQLIGNYIQELSKPGDPLVSPEGINISPQMLVGDFHFPVHDGILPLDRVALLDVWAGIFESVATNELLAQRFDLAKIFEHMAELGGAKNISQFKLDTQVQSPEQITSGLDNGNLVPLDGNVAQPNSQAGNI